MKTKFSLSLSFCFIIFLLNTASASHLAGGTITYQCVGNNKYQVTVTIYRDCFGIALATPTISVKGCGNTFSVNYTGPAVTPVLITIPCGGGLTTCNGGTKPGIQRYDFKLTVDLSTYAPCSDWIFSYDVAARNAAITTLYGPSNYNLYLEAHLNNVEPCHDSPRFIYEPSFFLCLNSTNALNCSANAMFDSLTYTLITPKTVGGAPVTYNPGFDSIHFITGTASLDVTSGMLNITPTLSGQVAVCATLIKQYRNGVLLGSVMRDLQFYINNCDSVTGKPPVVSGIDSTNNYSMTVAADKPLCFNLFSSCGDTSQPTYLTWDNSVLGATFTTNALKNEMATFCWTPPIADTGASAVCFTVTVTNNNSCLSYNSRTYNYCIYVMDSGYCTIGLTKNSSAPSCPGATDGSASVTVTGIPPYQYVWNNGATTNSITGLAQGLYYSNVKDSSGCLRTAVFRLYESTPYCFYNIVKGYCYEDLNANNVWDAGELPLAHALVKTTGTANSFSSQTDSNGFFYNYALDTGLNVTSPQATNILYHIVTPSQLTSNFPSFFNTDSVNFGYAVIPNVHDLRITIIPQSKEKVNKTMVYTVQYSNVGTDTMNGTVAMIKDSRLTYVTSAPPFLYTNGDSAVWNYSSLAPLQSRSINVTLNVPSPPLIIGDMPSTKCVIEPIAGNTTPADNSFVLTGKVVSSFDPNDKTMLGGDYFTTQQIADGDYMTYLIRFQNTGTDTAYRIVVRDTLDSKLNASTFEMVSASNNYGLYMENDKNLVWTFDNILLPDSNVNEPASHGYLCYRIKPLSTVDVGDRIYNTAHIFFDFNAPVATNTSVTTVDFPEMTGKEKNTSGNLILFPNPSQSEFTILGPASIGNNTVEVYNAVGVKIYSHVFNDSQMIINCKQWASGIYFIRIEGNGNAGVVKMVKMD